MTKPFHTLIREARESAGHHPQYAADTAGVSLEEYDIFEETGELYSGAAAYRLSMEYKVPIPREIDDYSLAKALTGSTCVRCINDTLRKIQSGEIAVLREKP